MHVINLLCRDKYVVFTLVPLQRSRRIGASHPVEQPSQERISAEWGSPPGPGLEATAWKKAKQGTAGDISF